MYSYNMSRCIGGDAALYPRGTIVLRVDSTELIDSALRMESCIDFETSAYLEHNVYMTNSTRFHPESQASVVKVSNRGSQPLLITNIMEDTFLIWTTLLLGLFLNQGCQ